MKYKLKYNPNNKHYPYAIYFRRFFRWRIYEEWSIEEHAAFRLQQLKIKG